MRKLLFPFSIWALAVLFVLASFADEGLRLGQRRLAEAQRPDLRIDPEMRSMGGLTEQYENLGDVIFAGERYRDITFYVDASSPIEVMAEALDEPLQLEIYTAQGERTATIDVPTGPETPVSGAVTSGSGNRIRILREQAHGEQARFKLRVRQPS